MKIKCRITGVQATGIRVQATGMIKRAEGAGRKAQDNNP